METMLSRLPLICESLGTISRRSPPNQIFRGLQTSSACLRYKKKWVEMGRKKVRPSELALAYFDTYYPQLYGEACWQQMRIALLRRKKKYCALVNNYADSDQTVNDLISEHHAFDMFTLAGNKLELPCAESPPMLPSDAAAVPLAASADVDGANKWQDMALDFGESQVKETVKYVQTPEGFMIPQTRANNPANKSYHPPDLYDYIPAERHFTDKELTERALQQQSFLLNGSPVIDIVESEPLLIPPMLKCHIHDAGVVRDFPSPKQDSTKLLPYYLMDGSSVLPVLALNLRPNDKVLDLCAGPGGKSLVIAQTLITDKLLCVDSSRSRLSRLHDVLSWYVPRPPEDEEPMNQAIEVVQADGREVGISHADRFNKVLVDVPCNTDRLVLHDDSNNRFKRTRVTERLQLPEVQTELLMSGIRACKPGGAVVYSTCTLTPGQNDYVVESAVTQLRESEPDIEVVVQDTSNIRDRLAHVFYFWPHSRYGQLVLPHTKSNFGPMFFTKLLRIK